MKSAAKARTHTAEQLLASARRVLQVEADAIIGLESALGEAFVTAVDLLLTCAGRVVVTGMGKSGHIARKIAATLASTGTPAFFLHPAEATHGDLGMITATDVLLALSNSGESVEILTLLPMVKRLGVPLVAMTGKPASALARQADVHLLVQVKQEACPLGLAPTASTTAALALGDALAVTLLECRGFSADDFARSHPSGTLGRRLLVKVADVMHTGERLPLIEPDMPLARALLEMSGKGLGMVVVGDNEGRLLGIFTDGDLRRALERDVDLRNVRVGDLMTPEPYCVGAGQLAVEAVYLMETHHINGLVVVDDRRMVVGALNMHDLFRAGVL